MNKKNIFEHISYEFDMYLYTFHKIYEMCLYKIHRGYTENQNLFNAFWDSHFLHLRNLIDFFNYDCSQFTDITVKTFFDNKICKEFKIDDTIKDKNNEDIIIRNNHNGKSKEEPLTFRMIINKSVDHITLERVKFEEYFTKNTQSMDMGHFQKDTIFSMIKIIPSLIIKFVNLLESSKDLQESHKKDFESYRLKFEGIKHASYGIINAIRTLEKSY